MSLPAAVVGTMPLTSSASSSASDSGFDHLPVQTSRRGELQVLGNGTEPDAERATHLPVRQITGPFEAKHILDFAHGRPVSRHRSCLPKRSRHNAGELSHPQYRQPKERPSFRSTEHAFRPSEQPLRLAKHRFREDEHPFRNAEHRFRNPPKPFSFERNETAVHLPPKTLFDFNRNLCSASPKYAVSGRELIDAIAAVLGHY